MAQAAGDSKGGQGHQQQIAWRTQTQTQPEEATQCSSYGEIDSIFIST